MTVARVGTHKGGRSDTDGWLEGLYHAGLYVFFGKPSNEREKEYLGSRCAVAG